MLLAVNFCVKVALLLLISPGSTISAGPFLFALVYSTGLYTARSAAAFAFCEVPLPALGVGLLSAPHFGWASASVVEARSAAPSERRAYLEKMRSFMVVHLFPMAAWREARGYFGIAFPRAERPALLQ